MQCGVSFFLPCESKLHHCKASVYKIIFFLIVPDCSCFDSGPCMYNFMTCSISFPEPRSPWPAVGKRELWEQPFWNNKGNNLILPIWFHAVCIYSACLKCCAPRALESCRKPEESWALGARMWPVWSGCEMIGRDLITLLYNGDNNDIFCSRTWLWIALGC